MEQYRDTKKTQRQASPIQDLIRSMMRHDHREMEHDGVGVGELHDHMHYENGRLVEDTPNTVPDLEGKDIAFAPPLGSVALNKMRVDE